jgi:hypothetical protein
MHSSNYLIVQTPSKNQIAKRQKQAKMELPILKDASSEREAEDAAMLLKVSFGYMVLSIHDTMSDVG